MGNKESWSAIGSSGQRKLNSERIETNTKMDERVKEEEKEMKLHIEPKKVLERDGKGKKKEIRQLREEWEMEGFMSMNSVEKGNSEVEAGQEQEGGKKGDKQDPKELMLIKYKKK